MRTYAPHSRSIDIRRSASTTIPWTKWLSSPGSLSVETFWKHGSVKHEVSNLSGCFYGFPVGIVLLKGALILKTIGVRRARPTLDIDLLRRGKADPPTLIALIQDCAQVQDPSDGVIFDVRDRHDSPGMSGLADLTVRIPPALYPRVLDRSL